MVMGVQDCRTMGKKEEMTVTAISGIIKNIRSSEGKDFTRIEYNQENSKRVLKEHASFVLDLMDKFDKR